MLFAPGVSESVWFTEQFNKRGIPWAHVDATDCVVDGERRKLDIPTWIEIQDRVKDGSIKGISNRFKCREGLDIPSAYCAILATPIGSLASYLQIVGRVLRSHPSKDRCVILDHGGAYWRQGSPNDDRDWHEWWSLPEHAVSEMHQLKIREKKKEEPICCPTCQMERTGGLECPGCGHRSEKSRRMVIMENGEMKQYDGKLVKPKFVKREPNTEDIWTGMAHGWRRKKVDRTWNQLAGFFAHENGYHPPKDLKMMPRKEEDWYRPVWAVDACDLY